MGISIWQILIIGIVLVLLFGRGKISELMGDVAKGIKSFKKGMAEDDEATGEPRTIDHSPAQAASAQTGTAQGTKVPESERRNA